jgi:hypothetical protein
MSSGISGRSGKQFPGVVFTVVPDGVRLTLTRRADLVRSRLDQQARSIADLERVKRDAAKAGTTLLREIERKEIGVVLAPSPEFARKLRRVLERAFLSSGSGGILTIDQAEDALGRCRRLGMVCHRGEVPIPGPRSIGNKVATEKRYVSDPMMSKAEYLHQLQMFPNQRWVGRIKADVNMSTLIGGLARIRNRTEAQTQGAAHYRSLVERAQLGGARAIDYERVKVDTSAAGSNIILEVGEHARRQLKGARARLGPERSLVAERVIVGGEAVGDVAESLGLGCGGTARQKVTSILLDATDELACFFGYAGGKDCLVSEKRRRDAMRHRQDACVRHLDQAEMTDAPPRV